MKNIEEITIRPVTEADAEKLLAIYAPYVTDTFVTYEYTVPTVEEFRERIRNTLQAYPYFAAVGKRQNHRLCLCLCISSQKGVSLVCGSNGLSGTRGAWARCRQAAV